MRKKGASAPGKDWNRRRKIENLKCAAIPQPAGQGSGLGAGYQTHGGIEGDDGGAAIADEGEGKAHNGEDKQAHTHIGGDLNDEHTSHTHGYVGVEGRAGVAGYPDAP